MDSHLTCSSDLGFQAICNTDTDSCKTCSSDLGFQATRSTDTDSHLTCTTDTDSHLTCTTDTDSHLTCSTDTGFQATCSTDTDSHLTCSSDTGFQATCSTDTDSRVTCSKKIVNCMKLQGFSFAERRRRYMSAVTTVEQTMILKGSNNERLTNADSMATTSFMHTSVSFSLVLSPTVVTALVYFLLFSVSDSISTL